MKERDDALKKARERKVDEMRVSGSIKDNHFICLLTLGKSDCPAAN